MRAATFLELAAKHGVATTYRPKAGGAFEDEPEAASSPEDVYRFANFGEFLLTFAAVSRSLRDPEDYARLAREFAADAIAQNVIYGELFVSPSVWQFFHPDIDVRACVQAIRTALDQAGNGVVFNLIVDLTRNFGVESAMRTSRLAVDLKDCDVIGIGLGGDEAKYPPELFVDAFAYARNNGLHVVAHAGEAAGPQSIRDAIDLLGAQRIGHGVRAIEDPALLALLAERRIPLEICPTSNFLTGVATRERPHPFVALDRAGCVVTIDADDPALFGTTISAEYAYVAQTAGHATLVRFIGNAIDASFACDEHKAAMLAQLAAAGAELPAVTRT